MKENTGSCGACSNECGACASEGVVMWPSIESAIAAAVSRHPSASSAPKILEAAAGHMKARASTYDKPEGERSMGATVAAFNAITNRDLTEAEGWLLMAVLKMVRSQARAEPHRDSLEDLVAYGALFAEARLR